MTGPKEFGLKEFGLREFGMKGFGMKIGTFAAALTLFIASPAAAKEVPWTLVVHGGAGDIIRREQISDKKDPLLRAGLRRALAAGGAVLERGGTAVEAVEAAVRVLEDDPNFNAGRGAVLTEIGTAELDASIMDGETRRAGAVAVVTTTRNPVSLARAIMDHGKQVMFAGPGADAQARRFGLEQVDPSYFITEEEKDWLRRYQETGSMAALGGMRKYGTVGAVARDRHGHLAAATSTGGRMGKPLGRVGDSPIIGAGTYADDRACAVSATGMGEYYIRSGVAHSICDRMRYLGEGPKVAADAVQAETAALGGTGGVIVVAPDGTPAISFNTKGMMRGVLRAGKTAEVALFGDE